jgi:hypothetical protein
LDLKFGDIIRIGVRHPRFIIVLFLLGGGGWGYSRWRR